MWASTAPRKPEKVRAAPSRQGAGQRLRFHHGVSDMSERDPRIDAYIATAAAFARPILTLLREQVHRACPDVQESIKWAMPSFLYGGRLLAYMAAFKQHASFGFWQHAEILGTDAPRDGMGSFGRLRALTDLPPRRQVQAWIRRGVQLIETDAKRRVPRPKPSAPTGVVPDDLAAALRAQPAAQATFEAFPPSCRREYVQWVMQARRPETRTRRIAQAVAWMAQGRRRDWQYRPQRPARRDA